MLRCGASSMGSSFFYQVIGALLMGLVSSLALAEQQGAPSLRVDSLNKEIEAESARLKELYASQDTLETQLSKLNVLLGDLETKQRVASAELGALVRQRDTLHAELESVGVEIEKTNTLLRRRVRIMYMLSQHRDRVLSLVFRDGDQPGRTLYFLSKVQNFDQMLLGAQQALAKELSG
jgi:septal ring factor EnvC (AmiA/AmiB activator)